MAKPNPDDLQSIGERLLAEWGAGEMHDVDALARLSGRNPAADVAIAHRLGAIATDASAGALDALERTATDKHVRREVKRARYRLTQRGVASAAPMATPAPGPLLAAPLDGRGDQLVWMVKPQPGGALHWLAVINDPEGLREVALHAVTRKALKELRGELERNHEVRLQAVDWHYADFLVRRAFDWARARGGRMDGDYPALRAQLSRLPVPIERPATPLPPAVTPPDAPAWLAQSDELLREPEMRTWFRPIEELQPFLEELASVRDSPLVLNEAQQQERFETIIGQAVDGLFGEEHRASWARRMQEQAVYFAAARRPAAAAQSVAVGQALAGAIAPHDVPFCNQLVRASLAYFFQAATEQVQEREKTSLVLTPQQAARRRPR